MQITLRPREAANGRISWSKHCALVREASQQQRQQVAAVAPKFGEVVRRKSDALLFRSHGGPFVGTLFAGDIKSAEDPDML